MQLSTMSILLPVTEQKRQIANHYLPHRAELGRSSWHLLHTMFARYPDNPDGGQALALHSYIYLFARLYPCGECATHFQKILDKFPPQVTSRSTVAAWGCHVHNEVNKSLGKEVFDCAKIGDFYDCGCGGDDEELTGKDGEDMEERSILEDEREPVSLEREGLQSGG